MRILRSSSISLPLAVASSSFVHVRSEGSPRSSSWYLRAALAMMYCMAVSGSSSNSRQRIMFAVMGCGILYVWLRRS